MCTYWALGGVVTGLGVVGIINFIMIIPKIVVSILLSLDLSQIGQNVFFNWLIW